MALAILAFMLVVLLTGLVVAASMAIQARRQVEHLEGQFPDPHGIWLEPESKTTRWSSVDLTGLHDDTVDEGDLFATLGPDSPPDWHAASDSEVSEWEPTALGPDSPPDWHAASDPEVSEWEPTINGVPSADLEPPADLAPVVSPRPRAWRPTADAPVVVLVVGSGFLGTGMTTAATRSAWQTVDDTYVVTLDGNGDSATERSANGEPTATGLPAGDEPSDYPSWRHTSDRVQHLLDELKSPVTSNGNGSTSSEDPKPIAWRPPTR